jgi:Tol biopolymer transport system component
MSTKARRRAKARPTTTPVAPEDGQQAVVAASTRTEVPRKTERSRAPTRTRRSPLPWIIAGVAALGLIIALLFLFRVFTPAAQPLPTSPEGRILFLRTSPEGQRNLFIVNPDGTGQAQVTEGLNVEGSWSWSPDGRLIVVQAGQEGQSEIVRITLGPDGRAAETVSLTADVNADAAFPTWSPDGSMIAFQHKGEGGFQVFVMNADGANKRKVSGGTGYAGLPSWSPDSKRIVFIAGDRPDIGTPKEIYVRDLAAGEPRKVTSFGKDISRPAFSPTGNLIAYIERQGDRAGSIMVVGADGQNLRRLGDSAANSTPEFSPDGNFLLFYNVAPPEGSDVYTVPVAGGTTPTNITTGAGEDYVPTWSPDGTKIAWASIEPGIQGHKIVVTNVDGSGRKVVSTGEGDDYQPVWTGPPSQEGQNGTP